MLVTLRLAYAIYRLRTMAASSSSWELPLVAVCQVTSTPDKEQNFKTCAELIREAARLGACLAFLLRGWARAAAGGWAPCRRPRGLSS